jgi:4-hydroxybenzoyl-CoA reductase subunit beta
MIRLPRFEYFAPKSLADAAAKLAESPTDTMLLAGGTDLVPNMKRRQQVPRVVVGLRHIRALRTIENGKGLTIGAGVTLTELASQPQVRDNCPGLWQAIVQVATPQLRNMATIGGNLCLDTRCNYYDQSYEWRKAIDFCMKKDGETCWVATSSPKCLAVSSTDTAPMLQALGATVRLVSASGERTVGVDDLYSNDGIHYLTRRPDEILTDIAVPDQSGRRSTYWKLRRRGSFDFPVASVAASARCDDGGRVTGVRIVLGAVASQPMPAPAAEAILEGQLLSDDRIAEAADAAYGVAKPMDNTDYELVWRKKMVRALVTYALRDVRGDDLSATRRKLARQLL